MSTQINEMARTYDRPDYAMLAQAYRDPAVKFVADVVMPPFGVQTTKGKYRYQAEKTWFDRHDTALPSPSGLPNEVEYSDTFANFDLYKLGLSKYFSAEELAQPQVYGYVSTQAMMQEAIEFLSHKIRLDKECRIADFVNTTGNYASGFHGAPGVRWDTYATSDPLSDVMTYKAKLLGDATIMVINDDVLRVLQQHPKILAAATVTGSKRDASINPYVTVEFLQNYFGIPQIVVAGARVNSASDTTATNTLTKIWTDNVFIGHVNQAASQSQMVGTFAKQLRLELPQFAGAEGFVVREHENARAGVFGGRHLDIGYYIQPIIHAQKLGALITDVLA